MVVILTARGLGWKERSLLSKLLIFASEKSENMEASVHISLVCPVFLISFPTNLQVLIYVKKTNSLFKGATTTNHPTFVIGYCRKCLNFGKELLSNIFLFLM